MNARLHPVLVLPILLLSILLTGCASTTTEPTTNVAPAPTAPSAEALAPEVSVAQALALRDAGAFILDVREPDEWAAGHADGATLIPLGQLADRVGEVPRDRDIVVVCRSGNRSAQGRDILLAAGFPRVTSLAGGMNEWIAAGVPIVTGP